MTKRPDEGAEQSPAPSSVSGPSRETRHGEPERGKGAARRFARRWAEWLDRAFFLVLYLGGYPLVRLLFPMRVSGSVPRSERPILLAPNHLSFLDPIVLQVAVPRRITYLMTEEYYRIPGLRWFFRRLGCIPIPVAGSRIGAVKRGMRALREERLVAIFPEGSRSLDGRLQRGFPGAVSMAERTRALVVPVGILGTRDAFPPGSKLPRPRRLEIRFGEPIDFSSSPPASTKERTRDLIEAIARLIDTRSPYE